MNNIPIIINVTSRVQYLPFLFNSLLESNIPNTKIHICSNGNCKMYNEQIEYHKSLKEQLNIDLQINSRIYPLNKFAKIDILNINFLHIQKIKYILQRYFKEYDSEFLIILKDDVMFNKDWYLNLVNIYNKEKDNLAFIGDCDTNSTLLKFNHTPNQNGYIPQYTIKQQCYSSSQCYLITRKFYQAWKNLQTNERFGYYSDFNQSTDFIMNQAATDLRFKMLLTLPQLTQHIGKHSTRFYARPICFTYMFKDPICFKNRLQIN